MRNVENRIVARGELLNCRFRDLHERVDQAIAGTSSLEDR